MASFREAYRSNEFLFEIDGIPAPGVVKVTGLSDGTVDVLEQPEGGSSFVRKVASGIIKFDDLTIERHMTGEDGDTHFKEWFQEMFSPDGPRERARRKNGSIVLTYNKKELARWVFEGAWIKSSKFTDLTAGTSALMVQTIVLSVDQLRRV